MDTPDYKFYDLLKKELSVEGLSMCVPDDDLISQVLSKCKLLHFPKNFRLVDEGDTNNSLYILRSGVLRISYYQEDREVTLGICSEPTSTISPLGFVLKYQAHYMVTTCSAVDVYELSKAEFDRLVIESPAFSRWMMGLALLQIAMFEYKSQNLVGTTKEKYESLRNREYINKWASFSKGKVPDIAREVNDRVIASFLDVHPAYLSTIKRELIEDERAKNKFPDGLQR